MDEALKRFPVLRYFEYAHLPRNLSEISQPFHRLAWDMASEAVKDMRDPQETAAGLRHLLEAKDCAVRSALAV